MFYKHGNYRHANNEVEFISQSADKVYSATGVYLGTHRVWQLKGRIHAANAAAPTSAIQALQAAYAIDGVDTGLYCDDGTPTAHVLRRPGAHPGHATSGVPGGLRRSVHDLP